MDKFTMDNGFEIPIVPGFREQVKSNWRKGYKDFEYQPLEQEKINNLKGDIHQSTNLLSKYGITLENKRIMDVGCYLGIQCFGAMENGAESAVGIDIPEYYVNQSKNQDVDASLILKQRRDDVREKHPHLNQEKIEFYDTSVFEMEFENEFDIIFSWETFEHIINPEEALKRIYTALKPGGISFNQYNPFFCISGGHSMCTLDYPFIHTFLTNEEFERYTKEVAWGEMPENYSELSCNFFTKNLNRMTQHQLQEYIYNAGFKTVDFITVPDFTLLNTIDPSTLELARKLHPTVTLNDLLCSNVYFIVQKPWN